VTTFTAIAGILMWRAVAAVDADALRLAQTSGTEKARRRPTSWALRGRRDRQGDIAAIDKEKSTVTLKGPKAARHPRGEGSQKFEVIKVGDPVVATYMEAVAFRSRSGHADAGHGSGEPRQLEAGETPARAVGQEVTLPPRSPRSIRRHTVTIKGPRATRDVARRRKTTSISSRSEIWSKSLICRRSPCRSTHHEEIGRAEQSGRQQGTRTLDQEHELLDTASSTTTATSTSLSSTRRRRRDPLVRTRRGTAFHAVYEHLLWIAGAMDHGGHHIDL
jgi:hypothetical protein